MGKVLNISDYNYQCTINVIDYNKQIELLGIVGWLLFGISFAIIIILLSQSGKEVNNENNSSGD